MEELVPDLTEEEAAQLREMGLPEAVLGELQQSRGYSSVDQWFIVLALLILLVSSVAATAAFYWRAAQPTLEHLGMIPHNAMLVKFPWMGMLCAIGSCSAAALGFLLWSAKWFPEVRAKTGVMTVKRWLQRDDARYARSAIHRFQQAPVSQPGRFYLMVIHEMIRRLATVFAWSVIASALLLWWDLSRLVWVTESEISFRPILSWQRHTYTWDQLEGVRYGAVDQDSPNEFGFELVFADEAKVNVYWEGAWTRDGKSVFDTVVEIDKLARAQGVPRERIEK